MQGLRRSYLFLRGLFLTTVLCCSCTICICAMPRTRAALLRSDGLGSPGPLSLQVLDSIARAGFGDARLTSGGCWEARCLSCTGPAVFSGPPGVRAAAICTSIRACNRHRSRQHAPLDSGAAPGVSNRLSPPLPTEDAAGVGPPSPQSPAPVPARATPDWSPPPLDASPQSPALPSDDSNSDGATDSGHAAMPTSDSDSRGEPGNTSDEASSVHDADFTVHGPRKGSAAWWFQHRLDPVGSGSSMSALQVAYMIAQLREKGVTKTGTTELSQFLTLLVASFGGQGGDGWQTHVPGSTHLVERVLGVQDAGDMEFGWCPTCGLRSPDEPVRGRQSPERLVDLLAATCRVCGTPQYKVSCGGWTGVSISTPFFAHLRCTVAYRSAVAGRPGFHRCFPAPRVGFWGGGHLAIPF